MVKKNRRGGLAMDRLLLILLAIVVLFSSITYLLGRISKRIRTVKYLPALICLLLAIYYFYRAKTLPNVGFEDLANAILALMLFVGFATGLVTGLILDYVVPRFKS